MEVVKSKKVNIVIFLLSALFLLGGCAFGQEKMELLRDNSLTNGYGKITTLFPSYTIFFQSKDNLKDTLFVGIKADSINPEVVSPNIYTFIPKSKLVNHKFLAIGFEDGTIEKLNVVYFDKVNGYVEYNFNTTSYVSLIRKKITYIGFDGITKYNSLDYATYFMDFLKLL